LDINKLLKRSADLDESLRFLLTLEPYDDSKRLEASKVMCGVATEHAQSLKILLGSCNYTSATSLARLQYETFVRAMWLFYAADDISLSKITEELTQESEKQANKLPMLSDMIKHLEGKAPQSAVEMINEFKTYSWKSLSSYVHGGIHALNRHGKGYPTSLIIQIIKISNGISTMTAMLLAIISGDALVTGTISKIQTEFKDCLPELKQ
jgi:hypothetical protein